MVPCPYMFKHPTHCSVLFLKFHQLHLLNNNCFTVLFSVLFFCDLFDSEVCSIVCFFFLPSLLFGIQLHIIFLTETEQPATKRDSFFTGLIAMFA